MTPDVRVVRGEPDDTELAALVAGLVAGSGAHDHHTASGEAARREEAQRRRWREGAARLADPLAPGPDAWRWSARA